MSAIYGIARFDGSGVSEAEMQAMADRIRYIGPDGGSAIFAGDAALGQLVRIVTPESQHERGPVTLASRVVLTAAGRIDNRDELIDLLGIGGDRAHVTTTELAAAAYERWGRAAPRRIYGDWAFAAWDPKARQLFLARDHFGNTALYYHHAAGTFTFASSRKALFALPHVPRRLNEIRLAQHLVLWIADGAATFHEEIFRVPAGHTLTITQAGVLDERYWLPEEIEEMRLPSDGAYVERFLELFTAAVRARVRTNRGIATTLSSGLDSGTVTALAAREIGKRPLLALTSVPLFAEASAILPHAIVDEWAAAQTVAAMYGNIDHRPLRADGITPLQALERSLWIHDEPEFAAGNMHWIIEMLQVAQERDTGMLLTGQLGNGGVSWTGDQQAALRYFTSGRFIAAMHALREWKRVRQTSWPRAAWHQLVRPARARMHSMMFRRGWSSDVLWSQRMIDRSFADRLRLAERIRESGYDPFFSAVLEPRGQRLRVLLPEISPIGALWYESGAAYGLQMCDPTADVRLLEFCLAIPDEQYTRGRQDRFLIRRALEGLVPPAIQWATRRGVQGADLALRLRADATNVNAAVEEIAASAAAREYFDLGMMRERWSALQSGIDAATQAHAAVLARSLLLGLFVARGC
jgi:asparagine synthase (glutamine-hydrolysing)